VSTRAISCGVICGLVDYFGKWVRPAVVWANLLGVIDGLRRNCRTCLACRVNGNVVCQSACLGHKLRSDGTVANTFNQVRSMESRVL